MEGVRIVPVTASEAVGLIYDGNPPVSGAEAVALLVGQLHAPLRSMVYELADGLLALQDFGGPGVPARAVCALTSMRCALEELRRGLKEARPLAG